MNSLEKELVNALRSGRYAQARGSLRTTDGYCCLGVACDVWGKGRWSALRVYEDCHLDRAEVDLPEAVRVDYRWSSRIGLLDITRAPQDPSATDPHITLAELNDSGFSFSQIADIIEAGLVVHRGE